MRSVFAEELYAIAVSLGEIVRNRGFSPFFWGIIWVFGIMDLFSISPCLCSIFFISHLKNRQIFNRKSGRR